MESRYKYMGFTAEIKYSDDDGVYIGHVVGIRDVIVFEIVDASCPEKYFHEAINDYLELCARLGKNPYLPMHHHIRS
jgi:predicted HicB family RNase H-like nuclease